MFNLACSFLLYLPPRWRLPRTRFLTNEPAYKHPTPTTCWRGGAWSAGGGACPLLFPGAKQSKAKRERGLNNMFGWAFWPGDGNASPCPGEREREETLLPLALPKERKRERACCRGQRGPQCLPLKKTMGGGAGRRPEGRDNRPRRPAERKERRARGESPLFAIALPKERERERRRTKQSDTKKLDR